MLVDKIIKLLGGYPDLDSFLERLDQQNKTKVLTLLVKKLYNTIGPDDILRENEMGQWVVEGKPITNTEKQLLIAEASQLQTTKLWKILQTDILYQANRKMFLLAKTEDDFTAGKLWKYTFDALNTRLKNMSKGKGVSINCDF